MPVELQEALVPKEGKLRNWNNARENKNYIKGSNNTQNAECISEESENTNYRTLNIATYNINRIKKKITKLELLAEWGTREKIDIIGINKSNINERISKFTLKNDSVYLSFWMSAEENKLKGSGVGFLVNKSWKWHIGRITRCSNYYITHF